MFLFHYQKYSEKFIKISILCSSGLTFKVHHRYEVVHSEELLFVIDNNHLRASCITSQWPNTHSSLSADTMPRFSFEMMHARLDYKNEWDKILVLRKIESFYCCGISSMFLYPFFLLSSLEHLMSYCLIWLTLGDNEVLAAAGCVLRKKFIK